MSDDNAIRNTSIYQGLNCGNIFCSLKTLLDPSHIPVQAFRAFLVY